MAMTWTTIKVHWPLPASHIMEASKLYQLGIECYLVCSLILAHSAVAFFQLCFVL
ncbi:hypothetical protein SDJN02_12939 [Cucurbita argyrosperma subsp. argyrosperma]|nr:hypothetical protein SDJN02_12939 [Cucurbita argyrosperma subsp. argyrosperma]